MGPFFPPSRLYHYRRVLSKDNDTYIYSTWVRCLARSHRADRPLLSSLKTLAPLPFQFLSLPQQTRGICYLSPNLLCFFSQWFINRVLLSISKDTEAGREWGREKREGWGICWENREEGQKAEWEYMITCSTVTHNVCVDILDQCGTQMQRALGLNPLDVKSHVKTIGATRILRSYGVSLGTSLEHKVQYAHGPPQDSFTAVALWPVLPSRGGHRPPERYS